MVYNGFYLSQKHFVLLTTLPSAAGTQGLGQPAGGGTEADFGRFSANTLFGTLGHLALQRSQSHK